MKNYLIIIENTKDNTCYSYVVYARDYDHAKQLGYAIAEELQNMKSFFITDVGNIDISITDLEVS